MEDVAFPQGGPTLTIKIYSESLDEWIDITVRDEKMVTQLRMMRKKEESIPKFARAFREMGLIENK